jgi:hypothetical protein
MTAWYCTYRCATNTSATTASLEDGDDVAGRGAETDEGGGGGDSTRIPGSPAQAARTVPAAATVMRMRAAAADDAGDWGSRCCRALSLMVTSLSRT